MPGERSQDLAQFAPYHRLLPGSSDKPLPSFRSPVSVRGRWLWGILWGALIGFNSAPLIAQQVPVRELQDPRVQDAPVPSVKPIAPPALDPALEAAKKKTIR
ncbi:MAG: hypothetical protein ACK523_21270 [Pirellulaceae bacterium]